MNKTNIRYIITLSLIVLLLFSLRYWALGPSNPSMIKTNHNSNNTIEEFKQQEKDKCGLCDGICENQLEHCNISVPKLTPSSDCKTIIQKRPFTLKIKDTKYYLGFSSPDSKSFIFVDKHNIRRKAQKWELIGVFDSKSNGCEYFIRSVSNSDDDGTVPNYYLSADKDYNLFVSSYGMGSNQKWQIDTNNGTIMTTKYKRYLSAITSSKGIVNLQCKPLPKDSNWVLEFDEDESATNVDDKKTNDEKTEVKESFDNIVSILANKNPGLRDKKWNGLWIYGNTTPGDIYMINLDDNNTSAQTTTPTTSDEKKINEKNFLNIQLSNGKGRITTYKRDDSGSLSDKPSIWDAELVLGSAKDGTDDVLYANQKNGSHKLVGYTVNTESIKDDKDPNAKYIKLIRYDGTGKNIGSLCVNPYNSSDGISKNIDALCKKVKSDGIIRSRDFNEIMGIKRTDYKNSINLPNV